MLDRGGLKTFEEVKQWLNRAYKIDELIQIDKRKLEELEALSTTIGGFTIDERVQTSPNLEAPFLNKVVNIADVREKLNLRIVERHNIKQ